MILIYPPVSKGCEPPAGVALLSGALKRHGIPCTVIDANIEGLMWLARHGDIGTRCHLDISNPWQSRSTLPLNLHGGTPAILDNENHTDIFTIKEKSQQKLDSWTRRARTHLERNLKDLKTPDLYQNIDRYRQRLMDLNRVLTKATDPRYKVSLTDYTDTQWSPLKSQDLLRSAENYVENPFYPYFESRLKAVIQKNDNNFHIGARHPNGDRYQIIGISLCYLNQALTAFALAGWIRARFPEKRIVMGGGLVTSWLSNPDWNARYGSLKIFRRHPFDHLIDILVKGRGEEALVKLAGGVPDQHEKSDPDFDFCQWEDYLAPGRVLPFRAADGCYWRKCRFCPERAEKRAYHPEKNEDLIETLGKLTKRHGLDYIHFIDDAVPPTFLRALAEIGGIQRCEAGTERIASCHDASFNGHGGGSATPEYGSNVSISTVNGHGRRSATPDHGNNVSISTVKKRAGVLNWYGFVRFTRDLADPLFCKKLYASGCRMLKLGLESGDQKVLDHMEKGTHLDLASKALWALYGAGIHTYVYLLFGTACEDEASALKTLDFVINHRKAISFLNLAIFNLPRFSEDAKQLETDLFYGGDLSLYLNFKHPLGWGRKEIRRFLDKRFKKEPAIASILKQDPPFFTSNHAMFMI